MICERFLAETLHSHDITKTLSAASKVVSKTILKSGIHWILQHKNDGHIRESWNDFCDQNPKVCVETTKMIDQIFVNDIDRYEIVTVQNVMIFRYMCIPAMIEVITMFHTKTFTTVEAEKLRTSMKQFSWQMKV